MKSILKSLVVITAVAAIAGTATYSYFTDQGQVAGITFSAGKLEIVASSPDWSNVDFSKLKPGDTIRKWVTIKNTGNLDVDALQVKAVVKQNNKSLLNQINVSITGKKGNDEPAYFTPDWTGGAKVLPYLNDYKDILDQSSYRTAAGVLHPDDTYTMTFDFTVPTSLNDSYQGAAAAFDLQFNAEQSKTSQNYF